MNKYIVTAVLMLAGTWAYAKEMISIPQANSAQALASADYGGVKIATSNFSATYTTAQVGGFCAIYGVTFSSGAPSDFVQIFTTGSWNPGSQGGVSTETIRVYNLAQSTGNASGTGLSIYSGYVPVGPRPIRSLNGCGFKPSAATYNSIILHYWGEE